MQFKLNYETMAKFDAMSKEDKAAAWEQLSPEQQQQVTDYFPTYKAEKLKREQEPMRAKEQTLKVIGEALGKADAAISKPSRLERAAPAIGKTLDIIGQESKGLRAGGAQGLSLGFSDEMEGALNALLASGGIKINDRNDLSKGLSLQKPALTWDQLKQAYVDARDARRADLQQAKEEQPIRYHVGEFAGSMAVPLPAAKAKGAKELFKAGVKLGAPMAATSYVGHSDEEHPVTVPGLAANTVIGGAVGGVANVAAGKVSNFLTRKAEEAAVKAAGLQPGITNKLRKMGISDEEGVAQFGREMLDEGLVPWSGSKQTVLERAKNLQDESGEVISGFLKGADEAAAQGTAPKFDYARLGAAADAPLNAANEVELLSAGKAQALSEALENQGARLGSGFEKANQAKSSAWRSADFTDDPKMAAELYSKVNTAARDNIQEQLLESLVARARAAGKSLPEAQSAGQRDLDAYRKAAEQYGLGAKAEEIAREGITRDASRAGLGMTELLLGGPAIGGGIASGKPLEGIGSAALIALLTKMAKKRGWGPVSRGSDALSEYLPLLPAGAVEQTPEAWRRFLSEE